jgi:hypothetical protein
MTYEASIPTSCSSSYYNNRKRTDSVRVKGGLNIANLSVSPKDGETSFSMKLNFHGGVLVSLPIAENLELQPEVLYSGQGVKDKFSDGTRGTVQEKLNLGYINVPVLVKYQHASGFFAEIGPQVGFLLSAKLKDVDGGQSSSSDFKSNLKSVDFAGCLGIGYLSSLNLGIDARYNLSFVNIAKTSGEKIKNGVIQIGVFYVFGESSKK